MMVEMFEFKLGRCVVVALKEVAYNTSTDMEMETGDGRVSAVPLYVAVESC